MKKKPYLVALLCSLLFSASSLHAQIRPDVVELQTNLGTIAIELDYAKAPITSDNFVAYVKSGFYRNTLIHRAEKGFVIQGGGYGRDGKLKTTNPPIVNEASNGLSNLAGTIAMARTDAPNSATSQFFINLVDNTGLNYSATRAGYAVFGNVVKGMSIVNSIGAMTTWSALPFSTASTLVWIDTAYTNTVWDDTVAKTRILRVGSGSITSLPAGMQCGGAGCAITQAAGEPLRLTATAASGFVFDGWRGDCKGKRRVINLDTTTGNHNCMAIFTRLGPLNQ